MLHCASSLYTRELKVILLYQPFQNRAIHRKSPSTLPCSPLLLHRILPFPQPLKKNNTPSPRTTTLASLVKGRWIGGKAQTLTLLHLLAIRSPFLYCKLFCRQDGGIATPPTSHRTNPSCCTECCHSHTTIAKEQQSLAQHFPYKTKRPHLITGAVLLILNLTASQDYRQAD